MTAGRKRHKYCSLREQQGFLFMWRLGMEQRTSTQRLMIVSNVSAQNALSCSSCLWTTPFRRQDSDTQTSLCRVTKLFENHQCGDYHSERVDQTVRQYFR